MELYIIKRNKGKFSKKGRVIKQSYWATFRYDRLFLMVLIIAISVYLIFE